MLGTVLRPVTRLARPGTRSYKLPETFKISTMNDLPVPQGSWQEYYNKKQKVYNTQLAIGIGVFVTTVLIARQTEWIYLNAYPPELEG